MKELQSMKTWMTPKNYAISYAKYLLSQATDFQKLPDLLEELMLDVTPQEDHEHVPNRRAKTKGSDEVGDWVDVEYVRSRVVELWCLIERAILSYARRIGKDTTDLVLDDAATRLAIVNEIAEYYITEYEEIISKVAVNPQWAEEFPMSINSWVDKYIDLPSPDEVMLMFSIAKAEIGEAIKDRLATDIGISQYVSYFQLLQGQITWIDFIDAIKEAILAKDLDRPIELALKKLDGSVETCTLTMREIIAQLVKSIEDTIAIAIGFEASTIETISDRVTYYTNKISEYYDDATQKASFMIQNVKSFLVNAKNTLQDWVLTVKNWFQFDELFGERGSLEIEDSDIAKFTGASWSLVIPWETIKEMSAKVGKAIYSGVVAIFGRLVDLASSWVWNYKEHLFSTLINPTDYKVVDDKSTVFQFDDFAYNRDNRIARFSPATQGWTISAAELAAMLSSKIDQLFHISLITGDCFLKINKVEIDTVYDPYAHDEVKVTFSSYFKPNAINIRAARGYIANRGEYNEYEPIHDGSSYTYYKPAAYTRVTDWTPRAEWINGLAEQWYKLGCPFLMGDEDEVNMFTNLWLSAWITLDVLYCAGAELRNSLPSGKIKAGVLDSLPVDSSGSGSIFNSLDSSMQFTNVDALRIVGGYRTDLDQFGWQQFDYKLESQTQSTYYDFSDKIGKAMLNLLTMSFQSRMDDGTDYWFIPYSTADKGFEPGRFAVKTDADNISAQGKAIAGIIIGTVALIGTATTLASMNKTVRYTNACLQLKKYKDKLSKGKLLSPFEQKQYNALNAQLGKMTYFANKSGASGIQKMAGLKTLVTDMNDVDKDDIKKIVKATTAGVSDVVKDIESNLAKLKSMIG